MAEMNTAPAGGTTTATTVAGSSTPAPSAPPKGLGGSTLWLILLLWGVVIYFFFMRPQRQKEKDRKATIERVKKGDRVVSIGGIHGTIIALTDETVTIKIDEKSGTTLTLARAAINTVIREE
ncbi:MAG: preprotein translocase subunit YajC [Planctomycetota bacterium]